MSKLDKFKRKDKNSDNVWSSISDLMSGLMIVFLFISVIFMSKVIDENTNTKVAFPMHFFGSCSLSKVFKTSEYASTYKDKIIDINKDGQTFEL